jgi:DNA-binding transcriptional LysR family regulator
LLLVRGKGSAVELTTHSEELVKRGRELLALNDETVRSLHAKTTHEAVRLGVSDAFTRRCLPDILARFGESEPNTLVEITRGASCELVPKLKAGELDLMLCEGGHEPRQWPAVELWRTRLEWITSDAQFRSRGSHNPL